MPYTALAEPQDLSWADVDPARQPFAWDEAERARVVGMISARAAAPGVPVPGTLVDHPDGLVWTTQLFAERYGAWTTGWEWSVHDAGPVDCWCCPHDASYSTPDGWAAKCVACLVQWRAWLEYLAETFRDLAPPPDASQDVRAGRIERAVARLVTAAVERTHCEDHWHALAHTTLRWYFEACGHTPEEALAAAETVEDGVFASWVAPDDQDVRAYARSLAAKVTGSAPAP